MLNQILNAQARGHGEISAPYSKIKWNIAEILKKEGFITEVEKKKKKIKNSEFSFIGLRLKYEDGASAIRGFKMISKPSRRMYSGKRDLKPIKQGYGISIISTPRGLMTGDEAKKAGVGGEVIFEIW